MATSSRAGVEVLDDLAQAVDGHAREARPDDAVAGVPARWVASPDSTGQASALLRTAARLGLTVVPRGRGTAMAWGAPPRSVDLVVGTERMDRVVEHAPGDLVCVVQAGATIDAINQQVGAHDQQLALDQPLPGATLGGTISTTRSGPRRLLYGTPRDQVLGVRMVRADGTVATAGSKVVKNVAGYDVAKLVGGAYGTLGLLCQVVVRLHPLPRARRWLRAAYPDLRRAAAGARAVAGSQLVASAVEVRREPGATGVEVYVLVEGTERGVERRCDMAADLLACPDGTADLPPAEGDALAELPVRDGDTLVKVAVPLPAVEDVVRVVQAAEARHAASCHVQGSVGAGVLYAVVRGEAEDMAVTVADLRDAAVGGSAVALQAPAEVRDLVDAWGPVGGLGLMRRVKDEFDPEHRLAPGRFVGGI